MELREKYKLLLDKYKINTSLRLSHFFAQIKHESNLKPINENLNYSSTGLLSTFGKYFDAKSAAIYARNPEKIANKVYANRMGNGDENSGDGWKYKGRGFIQITGKSNYTALSKSTGKDYINNPGLLLNEADAMLSALWFWDSKNLNSLADKDDINLITKSINGGLNGLDDRKKNLNYYKTLF